MVLWLLGAACIGNAQTSLIWDSTPATAGAQDGDGTWDISNHTNWLPDASSSANTVWPASGSSTTAIFGNSLSGTTPGTITVSGTVSAAGLVFQPVSSGVTTSFTFNNGTIALTDGSVIEIQGTAASNTGGFISLNSDISGNNLTFRKTGGSVGYIQIGSNAKSWTGTLTFDSSGGDLFLRAGPAATLSNLSAVVVNANTTIALNATNATYTPNFSIAGTGSTSRGALRFDLNNITVAGNVALTSSAMLLMNATNIADTISGNVDLSSSSSTMLSFQSGFSGTLLTVSGTISGAGGLAVNSGTVLLSGNNTFTGGVTINAGELRLGSTGALNSTTLQNIIFGTGSTTKTLTLNGNSVAVNSLQMASGAFNGFVQNGAANDATLTLTGAGIIFGGVIQDGSGGGKLSLNYNGNTTAARYALSGTNTFTGNVTIAQGTLIARGNNSALGAGSLVTVAQGAILELDQGVTITGKTLVTSKLQSANGSNTWAGTVQAASGGSSLTFNTTVAGDSLTLNGNVLGTAADGTVNDISFTTSSTIVVNGNIANARRLIVNGTGTVVLNGANAFDTAAAGTNNFGLSIQNGTVRLGNANALADTIPGQFNLVTFHSGNTSPLVLQVFGVNATARALFSGGTAVNTFVENGSATDATLTLKNADSRAFNGIIQDGSGGGKLGLTITGGSQTLFGASTYSGATTVNGGGTLTLDFTASGAPQNNILNHTANNSSLVLAGGTLKLQGLTNTNNAQQLNGLTISGGSSTINLANAATNNLGLSLGAITHLSGSVNFALPTGAQTSINGITTTTANNASGILGGWATVNGTDWAANNGSGNIVAYTGYSDVTNFSTGGAAVSPIPNSANANVRIVAGGTSGNVQLAATGAGNINDINSLLMSSTAAAVVQLGASDTLRVNSEGGIMLATGSTANLTIGATANTGTLTASGSGVLMISNFSDTGVITVNANINDNDSTSVSLVKNGNGLLVLGSTASTFSGGTVLNGGSVKISGDRSLGIDPSSFNAGNLTFNGGTLQWNSAFNLDANRGITLLSGGGTLDTQSFASTYSGVITGVGSLTKNGTGALTLSSANNYSGDTIVNTGIIVVTNNQALGSTAGGTVVSSNGRVTLADGITVTGETITINGGGGTGSGTATGGTIGAPNNGALQVAFSGTATWRGDVLIGTSTARLGGSNNSLLIIDGVIRNGGAAGDQGILAISTAGAGGIVRLDQKSTYTGATQIVRGTLQLGTDNALPATTLLQLSVASSVTELMAFDLNGHNQAMAGFFTTSSLLAANANVRILNSSSTASVLTVNQSAPESYDGAITGNVALVKDGAGALILTGSRAASSGATDYSGKTTVKGGILGLSGNASLDGTPWIEVDSGATFDLSARTGSAYTVSNKVITGAGSILGTLTVNGNSTIKPGANAASDPIANAGNTLGTLTIQNLTLSPILGGDTATSRLTLQLGSTTSSILNPLSGGNAVFFSTASSGGLYDSIKVTGTLGLNAGSTVTLALAPGSSITYGDVFNLLDWATLNTNVDGASGAFTLSDLNIGAVNSSLASNGWFLNTSLFLSDGIVYVVPEPSRVLLLGVGFFSLLMRRRRNRQINFVE